LRYGLYLSAAPFAACFACALACALTCALAYGTTSGHSKLQNWRLLFLVEGLPTLRVAVIAFIYPPTTPKNADSSPGEEKDPAN